jgi:transposase
LAHPVYVKPFAKKHVKTDNVDAKVLAQLLRMDYVPESYVPGKEIRDLRTIVRHRASLVRLRTSIKNFVSYAGLAQKVEQSGDYTTYGHISKHRNGFLRWAFIQSTRATVRSATPNRFQRIYNRLKARSGEKVAIVATARHMAESVYWVLTKKECYREEKKAISASSFS